MNKDTEDKIVLMKHTGSLLEDQRIRYTIDHKKKIVEVVMFAFDSSLLISFATQYLADSEGITAYSNDRVPDSWRHGWNVFVNFRGIRCRADVVVLFSGVGTVVLMPEKDEHGAH